MCSNKEKQNGCTHKKIKSLSIYFPMIIIIKPPTSLDIIWYGSIYYVNYFQVQHNQKQCSRHQWWMAWTNLMKNHLVVYNKDISMLIHPVLVHISQNTSYINYIYTDLSFQNKFSLNKLVSQINTSQFEIFHTEHNNV